jgi:hypothetical protein
MDVLRACSALFSLSAHSSIVIYGHNIQFNIAEVVKRVHVVQIKRNEVVHYIIQHE